MKTSYFTFGQVHTHQLDNVTLDKNCVLKVTAREPRNVMVALFSDKWAMEYAQKPNMSFYPRGVYTLSARWV